jgi:hypothetical protein
LAKGPRRTCWLVRSGSPARSANSTTRTRERCPDHGHAPCAGVHRRALKIVERAPASPLGWRRVAGGDRYHFCVWRGRLGASGQSGGRNNTDRVVENDPSRDMRGSELLLRKMDRRALFRRSHHPAVISASTSRRSVFGLVGSTGSPKVAAVGTSSRSKPSRFELSALIRWLIPVNALSPKPTQVVNC